MWYSSYVFPSMLVAILPFAPNSAISLSMPPSSSFSTILPLWQLLPLVLYSPELPAPLPPATLVINTFPFFPAPNSLTTRTGMDHWELWADGGRKDTKPPSVDDNDYLLYITHNNSSMHYTKPSTLISFLLLDSFNLVFWYKPSIVSVVSLISCMAFCPSSVDLHMSLNILSAHVMRSIVFYKHIMSPLSDNYITHL